MTDSPPMNAPRRAPPQDADIEQSGAPWSFHQKIDFRVKTIYFAFLVAMYFGLAQAYTEFWQPLFAYSGSYSISPRARDGESIVLSRRGIDADRFSTPVRHLCVLVDFDDARADSDDVRLWRYGRRDGLFDISRARSIHSAATFPFLFPICGGAGTSS